MWIIGKKDTNYLCKNCNGRVSIESYILIKYSNNKDFVHFQCNCGSFRGLYSSENHLEEPLEENPHLYRLMTSKELREYEKKLREYEKEVEAICRFKREEQLREMFNQEEIDIEITNIELEQLEQGA